MNIDFNWIEYKNIMSVGGSPIRIELSGFKKTLITGHNGAGKSTTIEALTFLLYGKAFRDIKKDQLVNTINKKGLLVQGEIKVGNDIINIKRGIKPNVFAITRNGEPVDEAASVTEFQAYFETELLGISYDSFKQIIVLGTAGYTPFMMLPAAKRRSLVEDLLDISVLGDMDKLNKTYLRQNKEQSALVSTEIAGLNRERETAQAGIDAQMAQTNKLIESSVATLVGHVNEVKSLKQKLSELEISRDTIPTTLDRSVYDDRIAEVLKDTGAEIQESIDATELEIQKIQIQIDDIARQVEPILDQSAIAQIQDELDGLGSVDDAIGRVVKLDVIPVPDVAKPSFDVVDYDEQLAQVKNSKMRAVLKLEELTEKQKTFASGHCPMCDQSVDGHTHDLTGQMDEIAESIDGYNLVISEVEILKAKQESEFKRINEQYTADLMVANDAIKLNETNAKEYEASVHTARWNYTARWSELNSSIEKIKRNYETTLNKFRLDKVNSLSDLNAKVSSLKVHVSSCENMLSRLEVTKKSNIDTIESDYQLAVVQNEQKISSLANEIASLADKIETMSAVARGLKVQIDDLKATEYDTSRIDEVNVELAAKGEIKGELVSEFHARSIVNEMLKDNCIKAHIIRRYIPVFNKKINEYLGILGADYCFALDESFNETIKSRGREEFSYASFSEGEKARINLSLLFTWRDIASIVSGVHIGMLFMDEVFDGSCDQDGLKGINEIIKNMRASTYVISHRADAMDDSFDRHIQMDKQGRFTTML